MYKIPLKHYLHGAFFLALAVVTPQLFHLTGIGGTVFLPMHIPVILAGMLVCPVIGLYVGIIAPIISHLLTGMPPISPPILPLMVVELGVYGFTAGLLHRILRKNIYLSLILAMIAGRCTLGTAAFVMMRFFGFNIDPVIYVKGAVATGIPGIILQLILIPVLVFMIERGTVHERSGDSSGQA
jgi:LytS/YehU family sensor histidine kinase